MKVLVPVNERGLRIGQYHHNARLTDADVELIRQLADSGMRHSVIAEKFEISRYTVGRICRSERRAQTPARWITVQVSIE